MGTCHCRDVLSRQWVREKWAWRATILFNFGFSLLLSSLFNGGCNFKCSATVLLSHWRIHISIVLPSQSARESVELDKLCRLLIYSYYYSCHGLRLRLQLALIFWRFITWAEKIRARKPSTFTNKRNWLPTNKTLWWCVNLNPKRKYDVVLKWYIMKWW